MLDFDQLSSTIRRLFHLYSTRSDRLSISKSAMKSALFFVFGAVFFGVCHADFNIFLQNVGWKFSTYDPTMFNNDGTPSPAMLEDVWTYASNIWSQDFPNYPELKSADVKQSIFAACDQIARTTKKGKAAKATTNLQDQSDRLSACTFFVFADMKGKFEDGGNGGKGGAPGSSSRPVDTSLHMK